MLVYAHDLTQGTKHAQAKTLLEELWRSGTGVLSTQVLQELSINLLRKSVRPLPIDETRKLVEDYSSWDIVVNTPPSVLQALDLESRYQISFWDALIVQAAASCDAEVLYSEDLADGQTHGSLRVRNPLK